MPDTVEYREIGPEQLCVGLFVSLDMKWMDHPFLTNSFKVRDQKQLDTLLSLGLRSLRYDPARSDVEPLPPRPPAPPAAEDAAAAAARAAAEAAAEAERQAVIARKKARIEQLSKIRQSIGKCEREMVQAAGAIKSINQNLYARPQESVKAATALVAQMAQSLLVDKDLAIHAMNDKVAGEDVYYHSLNVSVLAMMLAREMKLDKKEVGLIGLGALFHDIGKSRIPDRILRKQEPLSTAEQNLLAEHPRYGEEIARNLHLPPPVLDIILHHHERLDGSGYPDGLDERGLARQTRVVAIANGFDNLCNQPVQARCMTPHEAVSHMFAKQRSWFDGNALSIFIRCLGIYPPGTVVRLTGDIWGMVVSVNVNQPLKPIVLIYDAEVPRHEAILLNLEEGGEIEIVETVKPADLPRHVFEYLSPRQRVTYYFNEAPEEKPRR
jgi:putative nucleotidyltransferase with HDIG domain